MNGVHDLGGAHGFGAVEPEPNEPVFHARWEGVMVAIQRAGGTHGLYNLDEFRHGIERMDPAHYLASSYYEHWLDGITRLLIEKGLIDPAELDARTAAYEANPAAVPAPVIPAEPAYPPVVPSIMHPYRRDETAPPRFQPGDTVTTRNMHPQGHTRLPRYVRGKTGTIDRYHGVFIFPDTHAHGLGEDPQPLYSVRFTAQELWGTTDHETDVVYIDLWESYLVEVGDHAPLLSILE